MCEASLRSHQPIYRPSLRRLLQLRRRREMRRLRRLESAYSKGHACIVMIGPASARSPLLRPLRVHAASTIALATNVVQIVISGTKRHTPDGVISMPAFGGAYSDSEIAAVANYVTARFGSAPSKLTDKDVAELRSQAADLRNQRLRVTLYRSPELLN